MALDPTADQPTAPLTATLKTGRGVRLAARASLWSAPTHGLAPGHLQANLLVVPSRYAADFRLLCQRNPVPCPLIAELSESGNFSSFKSYLPGISNYAVLNDIDIRHDMPALQCIRRLGARQVGMLRHCVRVDSGPRSIPHRLLVHFRSRPHRSRSCASSCHTRSDRPHVQHDGSLVSCGYVHQWRLREFGNHYFTDFPRNSKDLVHQ